MIEKHSKHEKLARPSSGIFGRNEWSFTGTDCNTIRMLAETLILAFGKDYNCAYIDTHHLKDGETSSTPGMLHNGAMLDYTNFLSYSQISTALMADEDLHPYLNSADLILVNGNHHKAGQQVIFVDEKKQASLQKRLPDLQNVKLIILKTRQTNLFDFLIFDYPGVPHLFLDETERIVDFFKNEMLKARPQLNGIVLAGGRSVRMGSDKASMQWHGQEQRYFLADTMQAVCDQVYISCRPEQVESIDSRYKPLADTFTGLGPYGAILSAFRQNPDAAWLVLASDLPLLNAGTIENLIARRNTRSMATAYAQPANGKPEPLIAIWEPKSYPILLSFLARGFSCPKKVLEKNMVTLLEASNPDELMNVNTPEEKEIASEILGNKKAAIHDR